MGAFDGWGVRVQGCRLNMQFFTSPVQSLRSRVQAGCDECWQQFVVSHGRCKKVGSTLTGQHEEGDAWEPGLKTRFWAQGSGLWDERMRCLLTCAGFRV